MKYGEFEPTDDLERTLTRLTPVSVPAALRERTLSKLSEPSTVASTGRRSWLDWFDQLSVTTLAICVLMLSGVAAGCIWSIEREATAMLGPTEEATRAARFAKQLDALLDEKSVASVQAYVHQLLWRNPWDFSRRGSFSYPVPSDMDVLQSIGEPNQW